MGRVVFIQLALASLAIVAFFGCPGTLDDPSRFLVFCGGPAQPVCTTTTSTIPPSTDDVVAAVFQPRCGIPSCHSGPTPQQGLDLERADVERLVGRTSSTATCDGEIFLVPGEADASLLFDKLLPLPRCGVSMPPGTPLTEDEQAMVSEWIVGLRSN